MPGKILTGVREQLLSLLAQNLKYFHLLQVTRYQLQAQHQYQMTVKNCSPSQGKFVTRWRGWTLLLFAVMEMRSFPEVSDVPP